MKKDEMIKASIDAFGKQFRAEIYWQWRNKYKDCKVTQEDIAPGKVKLTYPCGHTTEFKLTDQEMGKMKLANYHYPFCPDCRIVSYKAANKEREKKNKGLQALGLVTMEFPSK